MTSSSWATRVLNGLPRIDEVQPAKIRKRSACRTQISLLTPPPAGPPPVAGVTLGHANVPDRRHARIRPGGCSILKRHNKRTVNFSVSPQKKDLSRRHLGVFVSHWNMPKTVLFQLETISRGC